MAIREYDYCAREIGYAYCKLVLDDTLYQHTKAEEYSASLLSTLEVQSSLDVVQLCISAISIGFSSNAVAAYREKAIQIYTVYDLSLVCTFSIFGLYHVALIVLYGIRRLMIAHPIVLRSLLCSEHLDTKGKYTTCPEGILSPSQDGGLHSYSWCCRGNASCVWKAEEHRHLGGGRH
jgi:hypothetical protein